MLDGKLSAPALAERAERNARHREWLQQIVAGGGIRERAVSKLFTDFRRPVLAFFMRHGLELEQAEDLAQDVFVRVTTHAGSFRGESLVSTWIFQIARNRLTDHLRTSKPEVSLEDDQWALIAENVSAEVQDNRGEALDNCVQRGFARFAQEFPERAECLRRIVFDGWSNDDIAVFLSRTNAAAREFLSQSRKKLRAFLEPCKELLEGSNA